MEPDFSGWATKAGLKCSDGRTIMPEAFAHMDGVRVPLVWAHGHDDPKNVLGYAILHAKPEGIRADGFFNDTETGKHTKALVEHGDLDALSIYANKLIERAKQVFHGMIREVSLTLAGANPGAHIDFVNIRHSDGDVTQLDDEAIITTGETLIGSDSVQHADAGATAKDVWDSMDEDQQGLVSYMLSVALEKQSTLAQSDVGTEGGKPAEDTTTTAKGEKAPEGDTSSTEGDLAHKEGTAAVNRNVFENPGSDNKSEKHTLTHTDVQGIIATAAKTGSLKHAVQEYALAHGIENIDILFPEARTVGGAPEFDKRRTDWVDGVLGATKKNPFTRIKTFSADITVEEARAKGYVKGSLKKEEFFSVIKRITGPSTVYKKQKLDRDDVLDITDFDVVAWMKGEMRLMLNEELARAILIGDGRDVDDPDKIADPSGASSGNGIRSILNDDQLYAATAYVNLDDSNSSYLEFVDEVINTRRLWKGTGTPTFYTTQLVISKLLLIRDSTGRRMFRTIADLAAELLVDSVVPVEAMETMPDLLGIMVNLADYTVGADQGGEVNFFDFFDIDYNQMKYLYETRVSGALTKIRSALIYKKVASGSTTALAVPVKPAFAGNVITPATTTGVTYKRADTGATVTTGAPITLNSTTLRELEIYSIPASGSYYIEDTADYRWKFTYQA